MAMTVAQRREKILRLLRKRNRYQFGQPNAGFVGNSGCTDTSIQHVVWYAKDKMVSLNNVRQRSGAPHGTPMSVNEAIRALKSYGLPYEVRTGLLAGDLVKIAKQRGPVLIAEMYWAHPQWLGYSYMGRKLNGWTTNSTGRRVKVGTSLPKRRSGLTQWTFRSGHSVLLATDMWEDGRHYAIIRDHNHNSPSRPERPAYDQVTMYQLNRMLKSWPGSTLALVPSRRVVK
jgi:hypothetical protein